MRVSFCILLSFGERAVNLLVNGIKGDINECVHGPCIIIITTVSCNSSRDHIIGAIERYFGVLQIILHLVGDDVDAPKLLGRRLERK